jgi:phosphohistidine phosphatase
MNLYILRHGLAVESGTPEYAQDADRPLTSKGTRKLGRIADAMEALNLSFDLILSSPYVRARQTAEIVADALGARDKLEFLDELTPESSFIKFIEGMNARATQPENVLLVGHEPYLSGLISVLVAGDSSLQVVMKKGGLCKLSAESLKYGRCEWLLTPKQMCLMA